MNLRDLRYLVALADTRHFGRSAERCHVSQPTLSAQIKKLENYLGAELVERQPRRVALTEIGEQVVARARRVIQEADEIVELTRDRSDPLAGRLKVALIPTIGPYLLPRVSSKLRRQLPHLKLMLYEYRTEQLLERLRNGEIDLGILALPVPLDGLEVRELYAEPFKVALPRNHALAARDTLRLTDIAKENLLLLEDGHCLRDQALEVCSRAQMREDQDYRATSLETLRQMVAAGLGVTLLPELAAKAPVGSSQGVAIRSFAAPQPTRTVGAVWRRSSTRVVAIEAICRIIRTEMVKS